MTPRSEHQWQKLRTLVAAIDAAAMREPYPRLARLMQSLAAQPTAMRAARCQPTYN
jgi:hypothetical protein